MRCNEVIVFYGWFLFALAGGCSAPTPDSNSNSSAVTIIAVAPASEQASGPNGHILRLDRATDGVDALPSPSNDAHGLFFTAPCGCVSLFIDGLVSVTKRYVHGDSDVTFPSVLEQGLHLYQAMYLPINDAAQCVGPWGCPSITGGTDKYLSGSLTVRVAETPGQDHKKYPDRCQSCPAWCDPSHPLHATMTQKFPNACTPSAIGPIKYPHSCGPLWTCSYITRTFNALACVAGVDDTGGNPFGIAKDTRIIVGYNICRDRDAERRGGDVAWYADYHGNIVSCPAIITDPSQDLTFGSCCDLVLGECQ